MLGIGKKGQSCSTSQKYICVRWEARTPLGKPCPAVAGQFIGSQRPARAGHRIINSVELTLAGELRYLEQALTVRSQGTAQSCIRKIQQLLPGQLLPGHFTLSLLLCIWVVSWRCHQRHRGVPVGALHRGARRGIPPKCQQRHSTEMPAEAPRWRRGAMID